MEAVGARMGRSSTRYGPATVFSGPVRKWTKKWVPVSNPNNNNNNNHSNPNNGNGNNSHLRLFKWTPISSTQNNSSTAADAGKDADTTASASVPEESPPKKFRYVPVAAIEEQKDEATTNTDDETKPSDADPSPQPTSDGSDVKLDINGVSMEEAQMDLEKDQAAARVSETNLDLSLGLKAHDGERETGAK